MQDSQISTLNDLIHEVTSIVESDKFWWRGVKDAQRHKLVPGIFREKRDLDQEANKLNLFIEMAPARHDKCPSSDLKVKENCLNWLFLMQHHRLQTRLLDWTTSPLIATFFAVTNNSDAEKKSDGILWYLSPSKLTQKFFPGTQGSPFLPSSTDIQHIYMGAFASVPGQPSHDDRVCPVLPKQIDIRMVVQLSRFTIHGNPKPLEKYPGLDDCLHKIIIPAVEKGKIATQLAQMGISDYNLFPDLDHLASDLNQNNFEAF